MGGTFDMLEIAIVVGLVALLGMGFYLRRTMPWPFVHEGKKYRRMPDGTFQDAAKAPVRDAALIPGLTKSYEAAKYGTRDLSDLDTD